MYSSKIYKFKNIGIVGAGQMGIGIGYVASRIAGLNVKFVDPSEKALKNCKSMVEKLCEREI